MNDFPVWGGWRLSAVKPRDPNNWGTAALCPSHPSLTPESHSSAAPYDFFCNTRMRPLV